MSLGMNDTSKDKNGVISPSDHNSQKVVEIERRSDVVSQLTEKQMVPLTDSTFEYPVKSSNLNSDNVTIAMPTNPRNGEISQDKGDASSEEIHNATTLNSSTILKDNHHHDRHDKTQSSESSETSFGLTEDGLPDFTLKGACHLSCFLYRRNRCAVTHIDLDQMSRRQLHPFDKDRKR